MHGPPLMRASFLLCLAAMVGLGIPEAESATPPAYINYQGVLRDTSNTSLDGSFDMEFRFWSADVGGDEILIDSHTSIAGGQVVVSGGLFSVHLGEGSIADGTGPGTYASLAEVFRDYGEVWLAAWVDGEDLTPRVRVIAAAYALNASSLEGRAASEFLDTSAAAQTKSGPLLVVSTAPVTDGVAAGGTNGGAFFWDVDSSGYANLGAGDGGIFAFGNSVGGFFQDLDSTGNAWVGYGDRGIEAYGNVAGGYFEDSDNHSYVYAGFGDRGIHAAGTEAGGVFNDRNSSGLAWVGYGDLGIQAQGSTSGGYFKDSDDSGEAFVGRGDTGISAYGTFAGGYFTDSDTGGYAYVGYGNWGIEAYGNAAGGLFKASNGSGNAAVGKFDTGIVASGNYAGGEFWELDGSGHARLATAYNGIVAEGSLSGGIFSETEGSGWTQVAAVDRGIWATGNFAGGTFSHPDGVTYWAHVATPSYKIQGTGGVSFVQNHPIDPGRVIVYSAPEGDEVATYTRGTARLVDGEAIVTLGETFAWVTNPDLGLTAHLTPHGDPVPLAVESITTRELVVRGPDDSGAIFDYLVFGLRIGFEEQPVVQVKDREAPLPAQEVMEAMLGANPEARPSTALERFKGMTASVRGMSPDALDLSGTVSLRNAIEAAGANGVGKVDPEAERLRHERPSSVSSGRATPAIEDAAGGAGSIAIAGATGILAAPDASPKQRSVGIVHTRLPVSEPVEAGDLLALDPDRPGSLRRADEMADPDVVGVAAAASEAIGGVASAPVIGSGFAEIRVDAGYGEIRPGDLLVSSPTPGFAMRAIEAIPGTVIGKAVEPLPAGMATILILVMPR